MSCRLLKGPQGTGVTATFHHTESLISPGLASMVWWVIPQSLLVESPLVLGKQPSNLVLRFLETVRTLTVTSNTQAL